jgi:hypothetical protein
LEFLSRFGRARLQKVRTILIDAGLWKGNGFQRLRKNSTLSLLLGGAALLALRLALCFDRAFRR